MEKESNQLAHTQYTLKTPRNITSKIAKLLLGVLLFFSGNWSAQASHIKGGDFSLRYISGNNYELTLKVLRDCENGIPWFNDPLYVGMYEQKTNRFITSFEMQRSSNDTLNFSSSGCIRIPTGCTHIGGYHRDINLDPNTYNSKNGYYFSWERCCRNTIIKNIIVGAQPGVTGMTYYMEIPPLSLRNSSPVFKRDPLTLLCVGNPFSFNYDCTDADGDSLVYSLTTPTKGTTTDRNPNDQDQPNYPILNAGPYENCVWTRGYNINNIMDGRPNLAINSKTGQLTVTPTRMGVYAIAVKVEEFRKGVKIGEVRRELQLTVSSCGQNPAPIFNVASYDTTYVINATDTISFPIDINDPNKDSVKLFVYGDMLPGGSYRGSKATLPESNGKGIANSRFYWKTDCSQGGDSDTAVLHLIARDNGCPINKITYSTVKIAIKPQPTPLPPDALCMERPDSNTILLNLGGWAKDKYAKIYYLYRKNPDSTQTLLDSIIPPNYPKFYLDKTAYKHFYNYYKYYLFGINKCGKRGINSYEANTDPNIPKVPSTRIIYAVSVRPRNRGIEVSWDKSLEANFDFYNIYRRSTRLGDTAMKLIKTIKKRNQTLFFDSVSATVDVNKYRYCYQLEVKNKCGFYSFKSPRSCSILLTGEAVPFVSKLHYNPYVYWKDGVDEYNILREYADSVGMNSIIKLKNNIFDYDDDQLNPDHGAYWYRIVATPTATSGLTLVANSNDIFLLQKPLLYPPNAFTPNGDGLNDQFFTSPIFVKEYNIRIYNRWGEKVFESSDKKKLWDGTYRGNIPFDNVYIYQIIYTGWDGSSYFKYGNVTTLF